MNKKQDECRRRPSGCLENLLVPSDAIRTAHKVIGVGWGVGGPKIRVRWKVQLFVVWMVPASHVDGFFF